MLFVLTFLQFEIFTSKLESQPLNGGNWSNYGDGVDTACNQHIGLKMTDKVIFFCDSLNSEYLKMHVDLFSKEFCNSFHNI